VRLRFCVVPADDGWFVGVPRFVSVVPFEIVGAPTRMSYNVSKMDSTCPIGLWLDAAGTIEF
jgi:hypothetical protein